MQLPEGKMAELIVQLKNYKKKYINEKYIGLDESGTRLMINEFLTAILGFAPLDEVKPEYAIKGTYADYIIQMNGVIHIVVEVKAMSITLSDKHLRQVVNYAAHEPIEWALLTNGRQFQLYKVLINKSISQELIFDVDFEDIKHTTECIQYLTKYSVARKGLDYIYNQSSALNPENMARLLYSPVIIAVLKRELRQRFDSSFDEASITNSLHKIISKSYPDVVPAKFKTIKKEKSQKGNSPIPLDQPATKNL